MSDLINTTITMALLGSSAYFDLKEKKVPMISILISAALSIASSIYEGNFMMIGMLEGIIPGAVFCLFSLCSKGALGMGDGLLAIVCGICLGMYETLVLFFLAFLFAGITGFISLFAKKTLRKKGLAKGLKTELPLVPFLYLSYSIMCLIL